MSRAGLVAGFVLGCFVVVNSRIDFIISPVSTPVLLDHDVILDCVAQDVPLGRSIQYTWLYNGSDVTEEMPHFSIYLNSSLFIPRIKEDDLGRYQCIANVTEHPPSVAFSEEIELIQAYINRFVESPESVDIDQHETVTLRCISGLSAPPAIVTWQRDGSVFEDGVQQQAVFGVEGTAGALQYVSSLELKQDLPGEFRYKCSAHNPLNNVTIDSVTASVIVNPAPTPPYFHSFFPSFIISPDGLEMSIGCPIEGSPRPVKTWLKNGETIVNNRRVYADLFSNLIFNPLIRNDKAIYTCYGENSVGRVKSDVNLTVAYLDHTFIQSPQDQTAVAGSSVTLTCIPPDSDPPAEVSWYFNDLPVQYRDGAFSLQKTSNNSLHFSNVQHSDEGRYICTASNTHALVRSVSSSPSLLTVHASPLMLQPPISQKVFKGDVLILNCRVSGVPFPNITWYKDDTLLHEETMFTIRENGQKLVKDVTTKLDEGSFYCRAENQYGAIQSHAVDIFVSVGSEITTPPTDSVVIEGSNITLDCVVQGDPKPHVDWLKDGLPISDDARLKIIVNGLRITNADPDDEGTYTCRATNEASSKSKSAVLTVHTGAKIESYSEDQTVIAGHSFIIYCTGTGNPTPTISWLFNGGDELPKDVSPLAYDNQSLAVSNSNSNHSGIYTCEAENYITKATHGIRVQIIVPPVITQLTGNTTIDAGSHLNIECHVTGIPRPAIEWRFNNVELLPTSDQRIKFPTYNTMLIQYAKPSESGEYSCHATNDAGGDRMDVDVVIIDTPLAPVLKSAQAASMSSVNLEWTNHPDTSVIPITSYVIEYKRALSLVFDVFRDDIPVDLTSFEVNGLDPHTEYLFRIAAVNHLGQGQYSSVLGATTLETAPSEPRHLRVIRHSSNSITLAWEQPSNPNGQIRLYQLWYKEKYSNTEYLVLDISPPQFPQQEYTLSQLHPYMTYDFRVRAANIVEGLKEWGSFSVRLDATTDIAVPSSPPQTLTLLVLSSHSIQVSWQAISSDAQNGPIQSYIVQYKPSAMSSQFLELIYDSDIFQGLVTGLLPWRSYDVTVLGYNAAGRGPSFRILKGTTLPTAPVGHPIDFTFDELFKDAVKLSWKAVPLDQRNSDISGYIIEYWSRINNDTSEVKSQFISNSLITTITVSNLQAFTEYSFRIQAYTTQVEPSGFGPFSDTITTTTQQDRPGAVHNLTYTVDAGSLILSWNPPLITNGFIISYLILYQVIEKSPSSVIQAAASKGSNFDVIHKNDTAGLVNTTDTKVILDDLEQDKTYRVEVLAQTSAGASRQVRSIEIHVENNVTLTTSDDTEGTTSLVTYGATDVTDSGHSGRKTTAGSSGDDEGLSSRERLLIIGLSAAVLFIILFIIVVACLLCHKQLKRSRGSFDLPSVSFTPQSGNTSDTSNLQISLTNGGSSESTRNTLVSSYGANYTGSDTATVGSTYPLPEYTPSNISQLPVDWLSEPDPYDSRMVDNVSSFSHGRVNSGYDHSDLSNPYSPAGYNTPSGRFMQSSSIPSRATYSGYPFQGASTLSRNYHMARSSAVAIAADRNKSLFNSNDRASLLNSDSVVVYNERTAL